MQTTTLFETPVIGPLITRLSTVLLRAFGWRTEGRLPDANKYVIVAAPHTSNWDFPVGLLIVLALNGKVFWLGKDALFRRPIGRLFRWLGGIPVDRSRSHNLVEQTIRKFTASDRLALAIAPSGTRKRVRVWKTGFYRIAHGAGVPLALGFIDYRRKTGGFGPMLATSGDMTADMERIAAFYSTVTPRHPGNAAHYSGR